MNNIIVRENNNSIEIEVTILDSTNISNIFPNINQILEKYFLKNKKIKDKDINKCLGKYKKFDKKSNEIINKDYCKICYQDFNIKEYKRNLKCNHFFHKKCIDKWIKIKNTCPICRDKCI
jgi:hypothetical protein